MSSQPTIASRSSRIGTFVRTTLAGGAATLADLVVLTVAVALFHLAPRVASIPALLAGGVVNFYGNRHFAFRASAAPLGRQATLYVVTEAIALTLNGVLFDAAMRALHPTGAWVVAARLVVQNLVFIGWSYPVWRKVFATPATSAPLST